MDDINSHLQPEALTGSDWHLLLPYIHFYREFSQYNFNFPSDTVPDDVKEVLRELMGGSTRQPNVISNELPLRKNEGDAIEDYLVQWAQENQSNITKEKAKKENERSEEDLSIYRQRATYLNALILEPYKQAINQAILLGTGYLVMLPKGTERGSLEKHLDSLYDMEEEIRTGRNPLWADSISSRNFNEADNGALTESKQAGNRLEPGFLNGLWGLWPREETSVLEGFPGLQRELTGDEDPSRSGSSLSSQRSESFVSVSLSDSSEPKQPTYSSLMDLTHTITEMIDLIEKSIITPVSQKRNTFTDELLISLGDLEGAFSRKLAIIIGSKSSKKYQELLKNAESSIKIDLPQVSNSQYHALRTHYAHILKDIYRDNPALKDVDKGVHSFLKEASQISWELYGTGLEGDYDARVLNTLQKLLEGREALLTTCGFSPKDRAAVAFTSPYGDLCTCRLSSRPLLAAKIGKPADRQENSFLIAAHFRAFYPADPYSLRYFLRILTALIRTWRYFQAIEPLSQPAADRNSSDSSSRPESPHKTLSQAVRLHRLSKKSEAKEEELSSLKGASTTLFRLRPKGLATAQALSHFGDKAFRGKRGVTKL